MYTPIRSDLHANRRRFKLRAAPRKVR